MGVSGRDRKSDQDDQGIFEDIFGKGAGELGQKIRQETARFEEVELAAIVHLMNSYAGRLLRAGADWAQACAETTPPSLTRLGIGDTAGEWHDRFLIRSDAHMPHAVFIACGNSLQADWEMERLGATLEDALPGELQNRFAEGCLKSLETGRPVPVEGRYRDDDDAEVLFRCVMMPVRAVSDDMEFIYGAYSHKLAA